MVLGVKGYLLQFDFKWPNMAATHTNRLFTIKEMIENIKNGRVAADSMNKYPADGISEIFLLQHCKTQRTLSPVGEPIRSNWWQVLPRVVLVIRLQNR